MFYEKDYVSWTCGLGVIGNYCEKEPFYAEGDMAVIRKKKFEEHSGGTPFFVAGFINEEECKEMYELLEHHAVIAFQSPVMKNKNSGNKFFFCVMSTEPEHEQVKFSWPFKE